MTSIPLRRALFTILTESPESPGTSVNSITSGREINQSGTNLTLVPLVNPILGSNEAMSNLPSRDTSKSTLVRNSGNKRRYTRGPYKRKTTPASVPPKKRALPTSDQISLLSKSDESSPEPIEIFDEPIVLNCGSSTSTATVVPNPEVKMDELIKILPTLSKEELSRLSGEALYRYNQKVSYNNSNPLWRVQMINKTQLSNPNRVVLGDKYPIPPPIDAIFPIVPKNQDFKEMDYKNLNDTFRKSILEKRAQPCGPFWAEAYILNVDNLYVLRHWNLTLIIHRIRSEKYSTKFPFYFICPVGVKYFNHITQISQGLSFYTIGKQHIKGYNVYHLRFKNMNQDRFSIIFEGIKINLVLCDYTDYINGTIKLFTLTLGDSFTKNCTDPNGIIIKWDQEEYLDIYVAQNRIIKKSVQYHVPKEITQNFSVVKGLIVSSEFKDNYQILTVELIEGFTLQYKFKEQIYAFRVDK